MQKTRKLVAARYVRNSDPSKADSEVQKAQNEALERYALENGYECPENLLYADAISALKYPYWERKRLMQMLDDAETHLFDVVLCTEFFRVARTSSEQYAVIEYMKRYNVQLISITEKFENTAEGRLLHAVQGFLGEVEAEKIRIRTQRGKRHRAERGLTGQGKYPTYGYTWIDGEEYTRQRYALNLEVIHVDSEGNHWTEMTVIKFCFDSYIEGMSLRQIALTLTRLGVPTQRRKDAWDQATIRQFLTNICYTGVGINGRHTKMENEGPIRLPDGIYPKIIDPKVFEEVQRQLQIHKEMSLRNNHHPGVGLLRGIAFCGICGYKMQEKHYERNRHNKVELHSEYRCYRNDGIEDTLHHHSIGIILPTLDGAAWKFVLPYIQDKTKLRQHIDSLKSQVVKRDHASDLDKKLDRIKKSIAKLFELQSVADPDDGDTTRSFQDSLIRLQKEKRDIEQTLGGLSSNEEKQEKLLLALDKFEAWTDSVRPFLSDPTYELSYDDKREAMLIMGVKAVVWPASSEYLDRHQLTLMPPDISRVCGFDFVKLLSGAGISSSR